MKYKGIVYDLYHEHGQALWVAPPPTVVAILTAKKVSIDYKESSDTSIHCEATSSDGITYIGTWGYPLLDPNQAIELQRFERNKNNEVVLIGTWEDRTTQRHGVFIYCLWPEVAATGS
jgi:hypothetical protein